MYRKVEDLRNVEQCQDQLVDLQAYLNDAFDKWKEKLFEEAEKIKEEEKKQEKEDSLGKIKSNSWYHQL